MKRAQSTHSDESPAPDALETAARVLQRPASYRDARGYQCDLLAAAIHPTLNQIAYVESRSKKRWWTTMWDVSIQVHFWHASGVRRRAEIKSYNPFFGCEVEHFAWMGDEVLLIYSEKHKTYACSFGSRWPPRFVEIQFPWTIRGERAAVPI